MGTPQSAEPKKESVSVKIFFAVLILGFIAGGVGALKSYIDQRAVTQNLVENGVESKASVRSSTTTVRYRAGSSTEVSVSFDPAGPEALTFADVQVCTEGEFDEGTETVRIVYAPDDPDTARLAECVTSVDSILGLVFGVIFLGLGVFLLWRFVRSLAT